MTKTLYNDLPCDFAFAWFKCRLCIDYNDLQVYEYVEDDSGKCVRCARVEDVAGFVKDNQQYAIVAHHLSRCVWYFVCVAVIISCTHSLTHALPHF